MADIHLISTDVELTARIAQGLSPSDQLWPWSTAPARTRLGNEAHAVVAVDFPELPADLVIEFFRDLRTKLGRDIRLVAINRSKTKADGALSPMTEALGGVKGVVIADEPQLGAMLCAIANDPLDGWCAATALEKVSRTCPTSVNAWVVSVISRFPRVSSVKELAAVCRTTTKTLERRAKRRPHNPQPNEVVELGQASLAILYAATGHADGNIAHALGYSDTRGLRRLVGRCLQADLTECRRAVGRTSAASLLDDKLREWTERRR
jgi:hypothetical protein